MRIFLTAFLFGLFCIFGSSAAEKTPDAPVADARLFSAVTVEELVRLVPEAKELYEGPWGRHDFIVLTCRFFPVREWLGSMNSDALEPLSGEDTELKLIQLLVLKESGTGFTIEDAGGYLESSKQVFSAKNRKTGKVLTLSVSKEESRLLSNGMKSRRTPEGITYISKEYAADVSAAAGGKDVVSHTFGGHWKLILKYHLDGKKTPVFDEIQVFTVK